MSVQQTMIVLHPALAHLVNWLAVTDSEHSWRLITDEQSARRLRTNGQSSLFSSIAVVPSLTNDTRELYLKVIEALLTPSTLIATMLEPMLAIVGEARARFSLPGPTTETLQRWWDKRTMKAHLEPWDALTPWIVASRNSLAAAITAEEVIAKLGLPVFAKPPARYSSSGAALLSTPMDVDYFLREITDDYLLERFVDGAMYHVDSVQVRGETRWLGAAKYFAPCFSALFGAPLGSVALAPESDEFAELANFHEQVMQRMGPTLDGTTHLELFRDPAGVLKFCEVAARCPGLMTPEMYIAQRGVDLRASHYRAAFGLPNPVVSVEGPTSPYVAWWVSLKTTPGVVSEVVLPLFRSRVQSWWQRKAMHREGAVVSSGLADVLGKVLFVADTAEDLQADIDSLVGLRAYETE